MRTAHAGFSLIEALAAVALIGIALMPLYALQRANLEAAFRAESAAARASLRSSLLAFAEGLNPTERPTGETEIAPFRVTWSATPIAGPRPQAGRPFGVGRFELTLYEVTFQIASATTTLSPIEDLTIRQVG